MTSNVLPGVRSWVCAPTAPIVVSQKPKASIGTGTSYTDVKALSYSRISGISLTYLYENFDTPRSEAYFVRATYVPRKYDVPAKFPWRISDVPVFV